MYGVNNQVERRCEIEDSWKTRSIFQLELDTSQEKERHSPETRTRRCNLYFHHPFAGKFARQCHLTPSAQSHHPLLVGTGVAARLSGVGRLVCSGLRTLGKGLVIAALGLERDV
jgi:hypothetical protein